jgi:N-acylneuraminate cytidylyltransferase/CMP-N,N'-diacetyllegionaminic acid synthase
MINDKHVIALIPARSKSKRLPSKNIIDLCGKPLLCWPIETARKSKYIDKIVVSTDDEIIARIAMESGAEVPFIRPQELASDTASSSSVILHALSFFNNYNLNFDYLVLLEPTSPLTESLDIDTALEILVKDRHQADAIVSVSQSVASHPAFDVTISPGGLIRPYLNENFQHIRQQEISAVYFYDGSFYISDTNIYKIRQSFYHERTMAYIVPKWKSFEIDDMVDFVCIEAIMRNMDKIKK